MTTTKTKYQRDLQFRRYKPPYFEWYETDFRAKVLHLNWLQRLLYRSLLQQMFNCETRPNLPNDDSKLWKLAGAENLEMWQREKTEIVEMFVQFERGGQNLLRHTRVDEEWDIMLATLENASKAGKASGEARRRAKGTVVEQPLNDVEQSLNGRPSTLNPTTTTTTASTDVSQSSVGPASLVLPTHQPQPHPARPDAETRMQCAGERLAQQVAVALKVGLPKQWAAGAEALLKGYNEADLTAALVHAAANPYWVENGFLENIDKVTRKVDVLVQQWKDDTKTKPKARGQKRGAATSAIVARTPSLQAGRDFSALAKGDL
jgi:uncharacterized protein YdaU (DUF1376 family)